jgi:hypothetical protein
MKKLIRPDVQDAEHTEISDTYLYEREFSVHGHVILGICAEGAGLRQFNLVIHLENWSRLEVQNVTRYFMDTEVVDSRYLSRTFESVRHWCDVQATVCQMAPQLCIWQGQRDGRQSTWMTKLLESRRQDWTRGETRSDGQSVTYRRRASDLSLPHDTVRHITVHVFTVPVCATGRLVL